MQKVFDLRHVRFCLTGQRIAKLIFDRRNEAVSLCLSWVFRARALHNHSHARKVTHSRTREPPVRHRDTDGALLFHSVLCVWGQTAAMAALTGGEMCVKYLMFVFNFIFWVSEKRLMCAEVGSRAGRFFMITRDFPQRLIDKYVSTASRFSLDCN